MNFTTEVLVLKYNSVEKNGFQCIFIQEFQSF